MALQLLSVEYAADPQEESTVESEAHWAELPVEYAAEPNVVSAE